MSERDRPPRSTANFERWTDRQVREAIEQGAFDNLAGAGRPLPDLDQPHDDLRWLRRKLKEEQVAVLPPSLLLRQEVQDLLAKARSALTERQARDLVEQANARIRRANRLGVAGPPHNLSPYRVEVVVDEWHTARAATEAPDPRPDPSPEAGDRPQAAAVDEEVPPRSRWLRRRRRR